MIKKTYFRLLVTFGLVFSLFAAALPPAGYAQTGTKTASVDGDLQKRLSRIEEKAEARRKELGIPGMSLAIVKDGRVILSKGYGYKNFEKRVPVTAQTQFAIGSATKAFTALSVLISQDEGKLSLDDSPKKYLSYFKINDPEIDKNITIRNLLSHSSGLNRTDLGWITGKLDREEIIKVAGEAKPTAKLGEKFQYQNVMYTAAGEIVSEVQDQPWEAFVAGHILKPIGMLNSSMSVPEMQKTKDFSLGYEYNFDTKETRLLPTRNITSVAPAGAINSSADDMAKWLRFILNKGEAGGKRLVSEEGFAEWIKPQQQIAGSASYGLGWFLQDWKGKRVVQHGGNIDGFNSMVALIPEENVGFVMLTNVSASSLGSELMPIVWSSLLEELPDENRAVSAEARKEVGTYHFEQAGFDIEVEVEDGQLVAKVPNQPTYVLEKVEGRKYKLTNAPDGFFITFRDDSAYLEQPQGNFTLPKEGSANRPAPRSSESAKELVGKYESEQNKGQIVEIKEVNGAVSLVVGPQPPYPLVEKEKDVFRSPNLPDSYSLRVRRGADNKIDGIILKQPEGEFPFKFAGAGEKTETPTITVDELMAKMIEALGGSQNLRRINSRVSKFDIDFVHQGLKGKGTVYHQAPNKISTEMTITALGKEIGSIVDHFDGTSGGEETSFSRDEAYTGQRLEDVKFEADFYGVLGWKKDAKSVEIRGIQKVGDEDAYVVRIEPEKANPVTYYISTRTFLPLKRTSVTVSGTSPQKIPSSQVFSDYREVDGLMLPFKLVTSNIGMGDIIIYTREIKHNVPIDGAKFRARK
ncbi:MAG: serine hydrolase [Pyrinomonadaceae bacterium]